MEMNKSNVGFFSIEPPKLEDAGLEDPALPIEDIQVFVYAFLFMVNFDLDVIT